jgi:FAD/FMN-containing dehydrogenase
LTPQLIDPTPQGERAMNDASPAGFGPALQDPLLVHGLVDAEGHRIANWGSSRQTTPAVYVEPVCYGDVQAVIRDTARFPTPVHPVGSLLSVTSTIVNDGGTMVCLRKLDEILALESDDTGRDLVRVQSGCRLKKLNLWLQT